MTDSGGFPPGTPVSTHLFKRIKDIQKEIQKNKRKRKFKKNLI